ncbi:hypothetical protein CAEBREN_07953 [Caenorhabditis brenneri]|uniref:Uncharacterized protein n=1 Tax=Caenorhabditis brenneri TaxID=135651 RepID=G0NCL6_CAEBE|nr:hypothetical protein CAEBREN_07953 [Caenorhabditis brenneri]
MISIPFHRREIPRKRYRRWCLCYMMR